MEHVLASSQACGHAYLCYCGVVQSHDARRVRVYWEKKEAISNSLSTRVVRRSAPTNSCCCSIEQLERPIISAISFEQPSGSDREDSCGFFFALVLETLVKGQMTYPDTSFTISRTKAVRLLKCPLVRDIRDDSRGVVFYSSEFVSPYAPELTRLQYRSVMRKQKGLE